MEKYASMWKADTPVERQAEAREMWDDLTGIDHKKEDTSTRLSNLFPMAKTHNKEASAAAIRARLIGAGVGLGGTGLGIYSYNKSKPNEQGYTQRQMDYAAAQAAQKAREDMGAASPSELRQAIEDRRKQISDAMDEDPRLAAAAGVGAGMLAGGLGTRAALNRIARTVV